ncbi:hypothetical protein AVEN_218653-1 [Araneus ventricosus]|uniref:Uncharacterized protein n=1 Tax=Araneus ventricosus TaxID=182803 RepID=A0A4Y2B525_ARAVE|nr:hypothetical protein AVEN_218653-1 [Araneus ventricosus]
MGVLSWIGIELTLTMKKIISARTDTQAKKLRLKSPPVSLAMEQLRSTNRRKKVTDCIFSHLLTGIIQKLVDELQLGWMLNANTIVLLNWHSFCELRRLKKSLHIKRKGCYI